MSLLERWENALLDKYLPTIDCRCNAECIESWGECCGDCPQCGGDEFDYEDSNEARWRDEDR